MLLLVFTDKAGEPTNDYKYKFSYMALYNSMFRGISGMSR